eukprot:TRINITY_DN55884_c0_g1_i1.p1 TRINITY_DN55884_c0_g1~~TRINITY_DN55884_c0_g1_i1.p1  ORF type:complete len:391 (-),score=50.41 TRINITY_DN55884_c0_g1_i1:123-1295(-)
MCSSLTSAPSSSLMKRRSGLKMLRVDMSAVGVAKRVVQEDSFAHMKPTHYDGNHVGTTLPTRIALPSCSSSGSSSSDLIEGTTSAGVLDNNVTLWDNLQTGGYAVGAVIGTGNNRCLSVRLAKKAEKLSAVKISDERRGEGTLHAILRREFKILSLLSHPNVVSANCFIDSPDGCAIVMNLCAGRSLERCLSFDGVFFTRFQRCEVLADVLEAVKYLHSQGVAHCDLHPGNVVVDIERQSGDCAGACSGAKLVDFGSACNGCDQMDLFDMNPNITPPHQVRKMFDIDTFAMGLMALGLMNFRAIYTQDVFTCTDVGAFIGCIATDGINPRATSGADAPDGLRDSVPCFPRWMKVGGMEPYVASLLSCFPPSVDDALQTLLRADAWPTLLA